MKVTMQAGALALAVTALVSGRAEAQTTNECMIGEVRMFAGNFAPRSWALANGQILSIAQNTALFSILGTMYGGNGQTTFGLPDLRSRFPIGAGQGPGLSTRSEGEVGGEETVTLLQSEMPAHTHALQASSAAGTHIRPQTRVLAKVDPVTGNNIYNAGPPDSAMAAESIGLTGGSQPHDNMPPYMGINFIICIEGIYPSRN
jgi:microcystin-dependent protein